MGHQITAEQPASARSWLRNEERFAANSYTGAAAEDGVARKRGGSALILTAPHAVMHRRDGRSKLAEPGTGGLAMTLAAAFDASYVCVVGAQTQDAAWVSEHPFKVALMQLLTPTSIVLDLHGMRDEHETDVEIGLGAAPDARTHAYGQRLADALARFALRVAVNHTFKADRPGTITTTVQHRGARALQIEIAAALRPPNAAPVAASNLLAAMQAALTGLIGA